LQGHILSTVGDALTHSFPDFMMKESC
jgi:hypothetical protein